MTYEQHIREAADKFGATVTEERGGLRLTNSDGSVWHRLGGEAEERWNQQDSLPQPGRWVAQGMSVVWQTY